MVTDAAKQHLKEILQSQTKYSNLGIRLMLKGTDTTKTKFGLELSSEGLEDEVVEHEGYIVLLIGPEIAEMVTGTTLDIEDTPDGIKLILYSDKTDS
jgi:Fe-S cluster assembly iron-binding protein IscA